MSYQCTNCKKIVEEGSVFCPECGGRVESVASTYNESAFLGGVERAFCARCGSPLEEGSIFCAECGASAEIPLENISVNSTKKTKAQKKNKQKMTIEQRIPKEKKRLRLLIAGMIGTAVVAGVLLVLLAFVNTKKVGVLYYKEGKTYFTDGTDSGDVVCSRKLGENADFFISQKKNGVYYYDGRDYYFRDFSRKETDSKANVKLNGIEKLKAVDISTPEGYNLLYTKRDGMYIGNGTKEEKIYSCWGDDIWLSDKKDKMIMRADDDIEYMDFSDREACIEYMDSNLLHYKKDFSAFYLKDDDREVFYEVKKGEKKELPMELGGFSEEAMPILVKVLEDGSYYYGVWDYNEGSWDGSLFFFDGKESKVVSSYVKNVEYDETIKCSKRDVIWYYEENEFCIAKEGKKLASINIDAAYIEEVYFSENAKEYDDFFVKYTQESGDTVTRKYQIKKDTIREVATDFGVDIEIIKYFSNKYAQENLFFYQNDTDGMGNYGYAVGNEMKENHMEYISSSGNTFVYGIQDGKLYGFTGDEKICLDENYSWESSEIYKNGFFSKDYNKNRGSKTLCYFDGSKVREIAAGVEDVIYD